MKFYLWLSIALVVAASAAIAIDLAEYPAPFMADGEWNGLIVLGANAAVSDVAGAVDIAATVGTESTTTDTNDEKKVSSTQEINDNIFSKLPTANEANLEALVSGTFSNEYGDSEYEQQILLPSSTVQYAIDPDDDSDTPAHYIIISQDTLAYLYSMKFTPALETRHKDAATQDTTNYLQGLKDNKLFMLGSEYLVVNAEHAAANNIKLTLMEIMVDDTMLESTTKTYTTEDKDYEVTLGFVDANEARFTINGENTRKMKDGESDALSDGTRVSVSEILYQNYAGGVHSATFQLAKNEIELKDTDTANHNFDGTYKVNSETIDELKVNIKTAQDGGQTEGVVVEIDAIEINYTPSDDLYIPIGGKLSTESELEEGENHVLNGFDIEFRGTATDGSNHNIALKPSGRYGYKLEWTNKAKQTYLYDVISCTSTTCGTIALGKLSGSTFYDLVINENEGVQKDDYFVVYKEKYSHILRLKKIDTSQQVIRVEDIADGTLYEVSYSTNATSLNNTASLVLDGFTYNINVISSTNVTIDQNSDNDYTDTAVNRLYGGSNEYIVLGTSENNVTLISDKHNGATSTDSLSAGINWDGTNSELDINDTHSIGYLYGFNAGNLQVGDSDVEKGTTRWGTIATWDYTSSQSNILWEHPTKQVYMSIYVTGKGKIGEATSSEAISLIGQDISKLDDEVEDKTASNLILVGGPCANSLTADVMGNPADCTEGFEEGKGIIRLYENAFGGNNSALVVAGYSAADTRNAASVLKDYTSYALSGSTVVVTREDGELKVSMT